MYSRKDRPNDLKLLCADHVMFEITLAIAIASMNSYYFFLIKAGYVHLACELQAEGLLWVYLMLCMGVQLL